MKQLPIGFQYSKEAIRTLRIVAKQAETQINKLCAKDSALRARVNKLLQLIKRNSK
jgi:hypothetical protein